MEIYSKFPEFSGNKINFTKDLLKFIKQISGKKQKFFLIFPIILFGGIFLSFIFVQGNQDKPDWKENVFFQEEMVILNGNTVLPISNLPEPEPEPEETKKFTVIVTAYSSTPWETWGNPFVTAAGTWVRDGIIANNMLPFGTKIRMPEIYGEKVFVVEDRMNSRKGNYHFDIWLPSYSEAVNFGVKKTYIEILEN